ncbi:substrate-binding domain-containing protein [Actinokineospora diospyrosa]|uniref:ABC-type phosphate transport system, substrate-binding protein n=1 Tax=Actinokineospora diospyrosa TaxID=103728 RepID=A0ABT1IM22_9PSEU|nr:substrate-binding domain-containing protein [Actinokineospora diospyrosa]MCP2273714.1 ABC-type phosphate transport system, substrate-binding protein [Actinokineospora diospyrosa]
MWELLIAAIGVAVPIVTFLWESLVVGRKRLGYRVQLDTRIRVGERPGGPLRLRVGDSDAALDDPTLVLLRVENAGATNVDRGDYAAPDDDKVGLRISFPQRRVVDMAITELSDAHLEQFFGAESGLAYADNTIDLPRVPLNRKAHYKVLAVLEGTGTEQYPDPVVVGAIKGGVRDGRVLETASRTGPSRRARWVTAFLVLVIVSLGVGSLLGDPDPLDCGHGQLVVIGSTAFAPVLRSAARQYERTCGDARIAVETGGSADGIERLNRTGGTAAVIAFSDGSKADGYPRLIGRPIAFSLFTLVVHADAGIRDLSTEQVRALYAGEVANWSEVGGNDVEVHLVSRQSSSGTRRALESRVLGQLELAPNSTNCRTLDKLATAQVTRCERPGTESVLSAVAEVPGAIGYSEAHAAEGVASVVQVRIDGSEAELVKADHHAYPFWETEYAYTFDELPADSLGAAFLRYLTNEVGRDIIRVEGHQPCADLANPVLCQPVK